MDKAIKTDTLRVGGMTCASCREKIKTKLSSTAGITRADVRLGSGCAVVTYDTRVISKERIAALIRELGYETPAGSVQRLPRTARAAGLLIIIAALYVALEQFGVLNLFAPSRLAVAGMGYGMLLVTGLVTSVHCVAMCGGINLSQCIPKDESAGSGGLKSALRPAFLYSLGRLCSYTATGVIVGALGSVVTFSTSAQGVLKLIAGVLMVIMGLNMLGIFPQLRRIMPRLPGVFTRGAGKPGNGPLIVGLLNGLMPCGPLQAMQIYALSTGSPITGALSMALFCLGTIPLTFGIGALSSAAGRRFTRKAMTAGAVLVAVLGLSMLSQGLTLSGVQLGSAPAQDDPYGIVWEDGVQVVRGTLQPRQYPEVTVYAGAPVKWIIDAPQGSITGCNNRMIIYEYGVEHSFSYGENIISFTPERAGTYLFSCWMGMIYGTITVI